MTEYTTLSDPNINGEEREFNVGFTKVDDRATVYSNIRSQINRLLEHTDVECTALTTYNEAEDTYSRMEMAEYSGEPIVAYLGTVPIESLKINANPRSSRSYSQIISDQSGVAFDD